MSKTVTLVGHERFMYGDKLCVAFEPVLMEDKDADYCLKVKARDKMSNIEYNAFVKGEAERPDQRPNESLVVAFYRAQSEKKDTEEGDKPAARARRGKNDEEKEAE